MKLSWSDGLAWSNIRHILRLICFWILRESVTLRRSANLSSIYRTLFSRVTSYFSTLKMFQEPKNDTYPSVDVPEATVSISDEEKFTWKSREISSLPILILYINLYLEVTTSVQLMLPKVTDHNQRHESGFLYLCNHILLMKQHSSFVKMAICRENRHEHQLPTYPFSDMSSPTQISDLSQGMLGQLHPIHASRCPLWSNRGNA